MQELDALPDPCPLPEASKKRGLGDKDRVLHAPLADVGAMLYDKDAVYIDLPDWKVRMQCMQHIAIYVRVRVYPAHRR